MKEDVTDIAFSFLCYDCLIEDGVTFADIIKLIKNCQAFYFLNIFPYYLKEILVASEKEVNKDIFDADMDFLVLEWVISECDGFEEPINSLHGYERPQFSGKGVYKKDTEWSKKGQKESFSVALTDVAELMRYPLKLSDKVVYIDETNKFNKRELSEAKYTLFNIIDGIFWELSWHGSPSEAKKTRDSLFKTVEGIKSGKLKTVKLDVDAIKKKIDKKLKKK